MAGAEDIRSTLSLLFPEDAVVELRALGDGVHSGYFSDFDLLATRAKTLDSLSPVRGVYVTLNEVNPALFSRCANRVRRCSRGDATTADADIMRRRWLPIDFDPVRPAGVSSTADEHAAALLRAEEVRVWLATRGFPAPILADSGNGAHLLYRIDLANDSESLRLIQGCLSVLDALFSDDAVHCDTANSNAARIWKLYGTMACKGDDTPVRPHQLSRIVSAPDEVQVVPDDVLRNLAGFIPLSSAVAEAGKRRGSFDLRWWLGYHGVPVKTEKPWQGGTLFTLVTCPFSSAHTDGAFAVQFGNGAVFAGCHHDSCGGGVQRWPEFRAMYEPERTAQKITNTTGGTEYPIPCQTTEQKACDPLVQPPVSHALLPLPPSSGGKKPVLDASPSVLLEPPGEQQKQWKRAREILETGDPLAFLLDVFHRDHVGDQTVAECLIMSVASQSVENTAGLHVSISGNSGKGKTHACNAMVRLLPEAYRMTGTVSDKALFYYDDLRPGTVLLFDDVTLSDDMQEVLKSATANFRAPIIHRTLTRDRQLKVCTIPERCVWWLARVESVGDDQVMNRMLTVWIDDSKKQDRAVLEHMKRVEAGGISSAPADQFDLGVCRAMGEILKSGVWRVTIPFAERICFSAIHNRRNPGMLFDLIKCHALLHFLQRKTDADGALIATPEDFAYARRLFQAINSDVGGQETKLTKNEAATLGAMVQMGLEVFTIYQLQDALGLSYKQIHRLLHGYTNGKTTYSGILDKCPAVSPITASVAEMLGGVEVRRQQHYFSFDSVMYHEWAAGSDVWLKPDDGPDGDDDDGHAGGDDAVQTRDDDEPAGSDVVQVRGDDEHAGGNVVQTRDDDVPAGSEAVQVRDDGGERKEGDQITDGGENYFSTFPPAFHPKKAKSGKVIDEQNGGNLGKEGSIIDIYTYSTVVSHPNPISFSNPISCNDERVCVSVPGESGKRMDLTSPHTQIPVPPSEVALKKVESEWKWVGTGGKVENKVETEGERGGETEGKIQENPRKVGCTLPLPGILDPRNFRRSLACLGTCCLCGKDAAVYHSDEERTSVCEGCYARLIRERNRDDGVM